MTANNEQPIHVENPTKGVKELHVNILESHIGDLVKEKIYSNDALKATQKTVDSHLKAFEKRAKEAADLRSWANPFPKNQKVDAYNQIMEEYAAKGNQILDTVSSNQKRAERIAELKAEKKIKEQVFMRDEAAELGRQISELEGITTFDQLKLTMGSSDKLGKDMDEVVKKQFEMNQKNFDNLLSNIDERAANAPAPAPKQKTEWKLGNPFMPATEKKALDEIEKSEKT